MQSSAKNICTHVIRRVYSTSNYEDSDITTAVYVHRFIVREYVYHNVLYVTHDDGNDDFLREGKIAITDMRVRQEGEGRRRERDQHVST
jgi:hypothetical protein